MALFVDDYAILDTNAIVFASVVNPCDYDLDDDQTYLIALMLRVGHVGHSCCIEYPQRGLRDAAFEQLVALTKQASRAAEEE